MKALLDDSASLADKVQAAKALATSKDPAALDALAKALTVVDVGLRQAVVASLQALSAAAVFEARLVDAKASAASRAEAAMVLRSLRPPSAIAPLTAALADPDPAVRREAALALSMVGAAAAESALITALADPDADVRYHAVEALGTVKTPRALEAIQARFAVETNPTVTFALMGARNALSTDAGVSGR